MKLKTKSKRRQFKLMNHLGIPEAERWANEVIEGIENDGLLVFDPKDENALHYVLDEEGNEQLLDRAKTTVSITEWLCAGCQCIRYAVSGDRKEEGLLAYYYNNSINVLWPLYATFRPPGPAAFIGEIVISSTVPDWSCGDSSEVENKFKFIVAHELVHVFDWMRFIVPAFMDWTNFWGHVVGGGSHCDILISKCEHVGLFVDSYGQRNELIRIEEYWPSQAKTWFDAFRQGGEGD